MGACIRAGNVQAPSNAKRSSKQKPTIVNSSSNTVELPPDLREELLEKLKKNALKTQELLNEKKESIKKPEPLEHFTKTTLNDVNKKMVRQFIEKKDLLMLHDYLLKFKISPHEEAGDLGYCWTLIHYACQNSAYQILEYLLRSAYHSFQKDYVKIVNSQSYEGWTPLMVIARAGDLETAKVLLGFGGVNISLKDKKRLTAEDHCINNQKKDILALLKDEKDFNTIQTDSLSKMDENKFFETWKSSTIENRDNLPTASLSEGISNELTLESILSPKTSELYRITSECIKTGKNYIDESFPHSLENHTSKDDQRYKFWVLARWLRPHELFGKGYSDIKLFDVIDPNTIKQGMLDTCHFLSILSSLAEYPKRVKKIFQQNAINKYGVYACDFYLNGKPKEVTIDDYFPCFSDKIEPLFARPVGNEIWPLVLEKAWCKMFGSYSVVENEIVYEAMEDILGAPSLGIYVRVPSEEDIFKTMLKWGSQSYIMSASTDKNTDVAGGLISEHTYSILGVYEVPNIEIPLETRGNKVLRLLKLRNPWGKIDFKDGRYSDSSMYLKNELKEMIGYNEKLDDGVFLMTPTEFYSRFYHLSVCMLHDNYVYQYLEVKGLKTHYFTLKIEKQQNICIRLHQENHKLYQVKKIAYKYTPVELILYSTENGIIANGADTKYVGRKSVMISNDGYVNLSPGTYYLRARNRFKYQKQPDNFIISTYSETPVIIQEMGYNEGKVIFYNILKSMAMSFENPIKFQNENCEFRFAWLDHLGVLYAKNNLGNPWKITVVIEDGVNIKLGKIGRSYNLKEFSAELPPKGDVIFLVKKIELHVTSRFTKKIYESQ